MKFLSNFENYRKDLADELREKRKESKSGARDVLKNEQKTEKYQILKKIKETSFEFKDKLEKSEIIDSKIYNTNTPEKIKKEIKVETIDISELIPENIRLWLDREKLKELKKFGGSILESSKHEIEEVKKFVNEITEGDFLDPNKLNTIIYGYADRKISGHTTLEDFNPQEEVLAKSKPIWFSAGGPHFYKAISKRIIIANPFAKRFIDLVDGISASSSRHPLYFSNYYDRLAGSAKNTMKHNPYYEHITPNSKTLKEFVNYANENKEGGLCVAFLHGKDITWMDFADWIVDLPAGRLYKISETSESTK